MTGCASLLWRCAECGAGSPARRAGNFLLRRQKQVTREEALNRTRPRRRHERRAKIHCTVSGRRDPLRSRCWPYDECHSARFMPPNVGCTPNSPGNTASLGRRPRGAGNDRVARATLHWFSREHGVQPRVRRPAAAMNDAGDKDSSESAAGRVWATAIWLLHGTARARGAGVRFRASSLVTFFWPRRRKLPRRRAALPAPHSAQRQSNEARLTRRSARQKP